MNQIFPRSSSVIPNFLVTVLLTATLVFTPACGKMQEVKIGAKPPVISGNDIYGDYVSPSQFNGKVVVLYFWSNSCCALCLKDLQPFFSRNRHRGLEVLTIDEGDAKEVVERYAKTNALTFTFQTDEHAMTARQYDVIGFPTIFILDRNGIMREKILGKIPEAKLEKLVSQYL